MHDHARVNEFSYPNLEVFDEAISTSFFIPFVLSVFEVIELDPIEVRRKTISDLLLLEHKRFLV